MQVMPLLDGLRPDQFIPPTDKRFWAGLNDFAGQSGSDKVRNDVRDGMMIPSERLRAYDPNVTLAESSRLSQTDLDYMCFGADRLKPRAATRTRFELEVSGEVSEWCCGIDSATMNAGLRQFDTKRGWFSISKDICWTDEMEAEYAGLFDVMGMYRGMAEKLLQKAAVEVAFFGSEIYNLHGVKDLPVQRTRLDVPFDQMASVEEAYQYWVAINSDNSLRRGDLGVEKTHMIAPKGWKTIRSAIKENSVTSQTLGQLMDSEYSLKTKMTDYMNFAGSDGKPALFLYDRNSGLIIRDLPFTPFMLPPIYERGMLRLQWVMRLGELFATNPHAALVVENGLTAAQ